MNNKDALDRLYNNFHNLIDDHADLPETKDAENGFWEYAEQYIFGNKGEIKRADLENVLYDVAFFNEKQGFFYGFNYAVELIIGKCNA